MAMKPEQQRIVGRALVASGALMFLLSAAFSSGVIELHPDAQKLVSVALVVVGVLDIGLGVFFLRKARG